MRDAGTDSHVLARCGDDLATGDSEGSGSGEHLECLLLAEMAVWWHERAGAHPRLDHQLLAVGSCAVWRIVIVWPIFGLASVNPVAVIATLTYQVVDTYWSV